MDSSIFVVAALLLINLDIKKKMIFFSEKCLEYRAQTHPESSQRLQITYDYLKEKGFSFQQAESSSDLASAFISD